MKYKNIVKAKFISRPNRFIANVEVDGNELVVHVKNTGRCKELLIPGCTVYLEKAENSERKTPYDLVAVEKDGRIINIDSQAPNKVVKEWLLCQGEYDKVQPEYKFGNSRIDFYMEKRRASVKQSKKADEEVDCYLMEVKGCTLFIDGIGYFPDAPTERGAKHLRELTDAVKKGYNTSVAFVIQGEGITEVRPNEVTDPDFAKAFYEAKAAGVEIVFYLCKVTDDSLYITQEIRS
ncbi:sugar fermentation stimulation protein A [Butyrivibrio hungatei DSM 14810]|uniref:Sugar fermentation stimulation protein homolog n=1 Tax=Butyrivibrio hungatei DSM 14810 TaxID=1121132 RepID=A0A1M7RT66_9FIRM|nr:DNA/RNA nuclease SfsA [Butyrivibrio hungatei]SHN49503.1 sugar fermentation stimulation protein A [Butyrivibrio hungatei DSM 14810]